MRESLSGSGKINSFVFVLMNCDGWNVLKVKALPERKGSGGNVVIFFITKSKTASLKQKDKNEITLIERTSYASAPRNRSKPLTESTLDFSVLNSVTASILSPLVGY